MDSIFGQDSDTNPENRSVRVSSANLNTPISNNQPPLVGSTIVRKNDVKESPLSNLPEPGDDGASG
jgi:hypothetical protein